MQEAERRGKGCVKKRGGAAAEQRPQETWVQTMWASGGEARGDGRMAATGQAEQALRDAPRAGAPAGRWEAPGRF